MVSKHSTLLILVGISFIGLLAVEQTNAQDPPPPTAEEKLVQLQQALKDQLAPNPPKDDMSLFDLLKPKVQDLFENPKLKEALAPLKELLKSTKLGDVKKELIKIIDLVVKFIQDNKIIEVIKSFVKMVLDKIKEALGISPPPASRKRRGIETESPDALAFEKSMSDAVATRKKRATIDISALITAITESPEMKAMKEMIENVKKNAPALLDAIIAAAPLLKKIYDAIAELLSKLKKLIEELIEKLKKIPTVKEIMDAISEAYEKIKTALSEAKDKIKKALEDEKKNQETKQAIADAINSTFGTDIKP
jgi:hypothetical protein